MLIFCCLQRVTPVLQLQYKATNWRRKASLSVLPSWDGSTEWQCSTSLGSFVLRSTLATKIQCSIGFSIRSLVLSELLGASVSSDEHCHDLNVP